MKRHGLQPEIQARCQVLWEPILYEPNHRNQLLSATSLSWKTSTPQDLQDLHYCSVSILHQPHPSPTSQSFLAPSRLGSWHPVSRPDNRTHFWPCSSACGSDPNLMLVSCKASVLAQLCSQKAAIFCHETWVPRQLPTLHNGKGCSCVVSAAVSPRPGVRPAWFPKASALAGNSMTNID